MRAVGALLALAMALAAGSARAEWKEGDDVPLGHHVERSSGTALIVGGAITFGLSWGFSGALGSWAAVNNRTDPAVSIPLFVPVLGPLVEIGMLASRHDMSSDAYPPFYAALVVDALLQGTGLAMIVLGVLAPRAKLVKDAAGARVVPMMLGSGGAGVGVFGRF